MFGLIFLLLVPIFCKQKIISRWFHRRKKKPIDTDDSIKPPDTSNTKTTDDSDLLESLDEYPRNTLPPGPDISNTEPNKKFIIYYTQPD